MLDLMKRQIQKGWKIDRITKKIIKIEEKIKEIIEKEIAENQS